MNEVANSDDEWEWYNEEDLPPPPGVFVKKKKPKPEPVVNWQPKKSFNMVKNMKPLEKDPYVHLK